MSHLGRLPRVSRGPSRYRQTEDEEDTLIHADVVVDVQQPELSLEQLPEQQLEQQHERPLEQQPELSPEQQPEESIHKHEQSPE